MNLITKVAIGVGTVGGLGGASFALQQHLSKEYISDKLLAYGYQILDDDNQEWDSILKSYEATVNKPENSKLKFGQFDGKTGGKEQLIKECKESLAKPASDKDIYEKAKHWCIVPITLETELENEGFKVLSTKTDDDNLDKAAWISKLADHVKKEQKFENKKFSKVTDIPEQGDAPKDKKNIDAIKKECEKLNKKKNYEIDFKENKEKATIWCYAEKNTKVT